ncbi:MAG: Na+/H+ antiporter [Pseudomonadota bacterium]
METISITLVLLLAVVLSGPLERLLWIRIPRPFIQIALGGAIALSTDLSITLHPDVFFLLFLPPLLFLDGWRTPRQGLRRDFGLILGLAIGLVVFTVLGLGTFIHWMIPAMPLAVAFALAAIVSPTDALAVSAILAGRAMPERLMHVLEGESLLNDASGLVCMNFAVAAVMTGAFSLGAAASEFVWLAVGGVLCGVAVTGAAAMAKHIVSVRFGEEAGAQVLISLLMPFGAYLAAEWLGGSPVLAAVAAGLTMGRLEQGGHLGAVSRLDRKVFWDMVQYIANGVVFVLLGEQLPDIVARASDLMQVPERFEWAWLLLYVCAIVAFLAALRFAWVWGCLTAAAKWARRRGVKGERADRKHVGAAALGGVRGAVTLAGILTLPLHLPDGSAFPARDLAIFLAAGVIIASLAAAAIGLPLLIPPATAHHRPTRSRTLSAIHVEAAEAAIRAIETGQRRIAEADGGTLLATEAAAHLVETYRRRIAAHSAPGERAEALLRTSEIERDLHVEALRAERDIYFQAARADRLNEDEVRGLVLALDLLEARLTTR